MTEIMEEDKVTIKEEISPLEDTCTVLIDIFHNYYLDCFV